MRVSSCSNRNLRNPQRETPVSVSKAFLRDTCLGETAPDGCVPSTILIANDSATTATKAQNFSPAISASGRYISFVSGAASTALRRSGCQLKDRWSCAIPALAQCCLARRTPTRFRESASALSCGHARLASCSQQRQDGAIAADRYSAAPLSADGRFAAFYAPDTIAAQPASGDWRRLFDRHAVLKLGRVLLLGCKHAPRRWLDSLREIPYSPLRHMPQPLKPESLRPGDSVRILSIASPVDPSLVCSGASRRLRA